MYDKRAKYYKQMIETVKGTYVASNKYLMKSERRGCFMEVITLIVILYIVISISKTITDIKK